MAPGIFSQCTQCTASPPEGERASATCSTYVALSPSGGEASVLEGPRLAELPPGTCRPRVKNIVNMQRSAATLLQTGDNFSTGTTTPTSSNP